jgi:nicotinamide mononucleotide transporter
LGLPEIYQQFITDIQKTHWYEYIAVFAGIASVWYSRKENILVYPVGLINTIIYVYISIKGNLFGEAGVNFYYTVMSIVGWYLWLKKDTQKENVLHITYSTKKDCVQQIVFFLFFYITIFLILTYFKKQFYDGVIPWADALASATAFTGMWLMTKKKVESWYWWIATNIASIPLYFVKHYVFTSVYYAVLLVMAIAGLFEWMKKTKNK